MSYLTQARRTAIFCFFVLSSISLQATAHVKWFAPYDINADPRNIFTILTPTFWACTLLVSAAIFFLALIDRSPIGLRLAQHVDHYRALILARAPENFCFRVLRYSLVIFFTCLWALGNIILTPELTHENSILVGAIQLVIILALFSESSAKYAGAGMLCLWVYSAFYYGIFHVSDYALFVGLGFFLIMLSIQPQRLASKGFLVLYCSTSITLLWASIEKFAYPEWSFPLLTQRPYLTMGLGSETFMIVAGLAEFAFAFLLIALSGIGFVIVTLSLAIIFIMAIFDFGKIDAIGHLAIIVSLFVLALNGPVSINKKIIHMHKNMVINAGLISLLYCVLIVVFFVLYYGVRLLWLSASSGV